MGGQVQRLEQVFQMFGQSPERKTCKGMKGTLAEGNEMIQHAQDPDVRDALMIGAAQHVEHYEMAGYGTVRTYAEMLGRDEHVTLLERTLQEEEQADELLTELAESHINQEAQAR